MPQTYPTSGPNAYKIPQYTEKADGVAAFQQFIDSLEPLITPIGTVVPWAGATGNPPAGWLLCNGEQYPIASYPTLAKLCGTTYGSANEGYFRVPNLKGRLVVGQDPADTDFAAVGKTGGVKSITLTSDNLPTHNHSIPAHGHTAAASGSATGTSGDASVTHSHTGSTVTMTDSAAHQHGTGYRTVTRASTTGGVSVPINEGTAGDLTGSGGVHKHTVTMSVAADGKHTHTVSVDGATLTLKVNDSADGKSGDTGTSKPILSLGPYTVLQYIIRTDIVRS